METFNRYKLYQLHAIDKVTRNSNSYYLTHPHTHTSKSINRKTLSLILDNNVTIQNLGNPRTWHSNKTNSSSKIGHKFSNNKDSMTAPQFKYFPPIFCFFPFYGVNIETASKRMQFLLMESICHNNQTNCKFPVSI